VYISHIPPGYTSGCTPLYMPPWVYLRVYIGWYMPPMGVPQGVYRVVYAYLASLGGYI